LTFKSIAIWLDKALPVILFHGRPLGATSISSQRSQSSQPPQLPSHRVDDNQSSHLTTTTTPTATPSVSQAEEKSLSAPTTAPTTAPTPVVSSDDIVLPPHNVKSVSDWPDWQSIPKKIILGFMTKTASENGFQRWSQYHQSQFKQYSGLELAYMFCITWHHEPLAIKTHFSSQLLDDAIVLRSVQEEPHTDIIARQSGGDNHKKPTTMHVDKFRKSEPTNVPATNKPSAVSAALTTTTTTTTSTLTATKQPTASTSATRPTNNVITMITNSNEKIEREMLQKQSEITTIDLVNEENKPSTNFNQPQTSKPSTRHTVGPSDFAPSQPKTVTAQQPLSPSHEELDQFTAVDSHFDDGKKWSKSRPQFNTTIDMSTGTTDSYSYIYQGQGTKVLQPVAPAGTSAHTNKAVSAATTTSTQPLLRHESPQYNHGLIQEYDDDLSFHYDDDNDRGKSPPQNVHNTQPPQPSPTQSSDEPYLTQLPQARIEKPREYPYNGPAPHPYVHRSLDSPTQRTQQPPTRHTQPSTHRQHQIQPEPTQSTHTAPVAKTAQPVQPNPPRHTSTTTQTSTQTQKPPGFTFSPAKPQTIPQVDANANQRDHHWNQNKGNNTTVNKTNNNVNSIGTSGDDVTESIDYWLHQINKHKNLMTRNDDHLLAPQSPPISSQLYQQRFTGVQTGGGNNNINNNHNMNNMNNNNNPTNRNIPTDPIQTGYQQPDNDTARQNTSFDQYQDQRYQHTTQPSFPPPTPYPQPAQAQLGYPPMSPVLPANYNNDFIPFSPPIMGMQSPMNPYQTNHYPQDLYQMSHQPQLQHQNQQLQPLQLQQQHRFALADDEKRAWFNRVEQSQQHVRRLLEFLQNFDKSATKLRSNITNQARRLSHYLDLTQLLTGCSVSVSGRDSNRFIIKLSTEDGLRSLRFFLGGLETSITRLLDDEDEKNQFFIPQPAVSLPKQLTNENSLLSGSDPLIGNTTALIQGDTIILPKLHTFDPHFEETQLKDDANSDPGDKNSSKNVYNIRLLVDALRNSHPQSKLVFTPGGAIGCDFPPFYQKQCEVKWDDVTKIIVLFSAIVHCGLKGDRILSVDDAISAYNQGHVDSQQGRGNVVLNQAAELAELRIAQLQQQQFNPTQPFSQPIPPPRSNIPQHIPAQNFPNPIGQFSYQQHVRQPQNLQPHIQPQYQPQPAQIQPFHNNFNPINPPSQSSQYSDSDVYHNQPNYASGYTPRPDEISRFPNTHNQLGPVPGSVRNGNPDHLRFNPNIPSSTSNQYVHNSNIPPQHPPQYHMNHQPPQYQSRLDQQPRHSRQTPNQPPPFPQQPNKRPRRSYQQNSDSSSYYGDSSRDYDSSDDSTSLASSSNLESSSDDYSYQVNQQPRGYLQRGGAGSAKRSRVNGVTSVDSGRDLRGDQRNANFSFPRDQFGGFDLPSAQRAGGRRNPHDVRGNKNTQISFENPFGIDFNQAAMKRGKAFDLTLDIPELVFP
jgi:hypothetical protein